MNKQFVQTKKILIALFIGLAFYFILNLTQNSLLVLIAFLVVLWINVKHPSTVSSGAVDVKTMMKYGLVLNIAGIILVVLIAQFFWKNIL